MLYRGLEQQRQLKLTLSTGRQIPFPLAHIPQNAKLAVGVK